MEFGQNSGGVQNRAARAEAEGYTVDYVMSRQVGQKVSSQATTHNGKNVTTNEVTLELSARRRAQEERIRLVFG